MRRRIELRSAVQGQAAETALQAAQLMRTAAAALPAHDHGDSGGGATLIVSYWWQVSILSARFAV